MAEMTVRQKYADDLYQVLKDLTVMAKMGVPISCINTYAAAVRNAEQLLKKIDVESMEDLANEKQTI